MEFMNHEDKVTFTINQVAKILGVVPATIRNWEKNGMISSKRSASNYRIFTLDDIETLKKIKEYSVDKHMGTQAIKMLLPSPGTSALESYVQQQKEVFYSKKLISEKWRQIRKQQGYTLEEVSRAHFYRESPLYFMEPAAQENRLVRKGCGEPIQLKSDPGLEMYSLIAMREHTMYPVLCVVEPGCGNLTPHTHNGEELIYMLSGVVEVRLNDDPPYILHPGDTFFYRGSDVHSWQNISPKPAQLLWIHSSISK